MRLLLVEDDPKLKELIIEGLSEHDFIIECASNATVADSMSELQNYDVVVLDVMLPEGTDAGFALAKRMRARKDVTPILFLTARSDIDSRLEGLEGGGDDYLAKPFDFRELRARIHALGRRPSGNASNLLELPLGYKLNLSYNEITKDGQVIKLTRREYLLLECFALNPKRTYSRDDLIMRVWPEESEVETKVVDMFVSNMRRKLGEGIIETVRGVGYRLSHSP